MSPPRNWILSCNSSCCGTDFCNVCEKSFPGFKTEHNGNVIIAGWALRQHSDQIDEMIMSCPYGGIELTELKN